MNSREVGDTVIWLLLLTVSEKKLEATATVQYIFRESRCLFSEDYLFTSSQNFTREKYRSVSLGIEINVKKSMAFFKAGVS